MLLEGVKNEDSQIYELLTAGNIENSWSKLKFQGFFFSYFGKRNPLLFTKITIRLNKDFSLSRSESWHNVKSRDHVQPAINFAEIWRIFKSLGKKGVVLKRSFEVSWTSLWRHGDIKTFLKVVYSHIVLKDRRFSLFVLEEGFPTWDRFNTVSCRLLEWFQNAPSLKIHPWLRRDHSISRCTRILENEKSLEVFFSFRKQFFPDRNPKFQFSTRVTFWTLSVTRVLISVICQAWYHRYLSGMVSLVKYATATKPIGNFGIALNDGMVQFW